MNYQFKFFATILLVWLFSFCLIGQDYPFVQQHGHKYKRKGITKEVDYLSYQRIKLQTVDTTFYIYPGEATAYKNIRGEYFESKVIGFRGQQTPYFLKHEGDTKFGTIYSCEDPAFTKRIFIQDTVLIELNNEPQTEGYYKTFLKKLTKRRKLREEILQNTGFSVGSIKRALDGSAAGKLGYLSKKSLYLNFGYGDIFASLNNSAEDASIIPSQILADRNSFQTRSIFLELGYLFPIKKSNFGFFPSISYTNQQLTFLNNSLLTTFSMDYSLSSIELTTAIKLNLPRDKWQPSVYVGPSLGFPLQHDIDLSRVILTAGDRSEVLQDADDISVQYGYTFRIALEHLVGKKFGTGVFLNLKQLRQTGGINPKFNTTMIHLGLTLFWK